MYFVLVNWYVVFCVVVVVVVLADVCWHVQMLVSVSADADVGIS